VRVGRVKFQSVCEVSVYVPQNDNLTNFLYCLRSIGNSAAELELELAMVVGVNTCA
jgi:hypothetical protein